MPEEEKGFVVKDRRIFTGENKEAEARDEKTQTQPSTDEAAQSRPITEKNRQPEAPESSKTDVSEEQPQFPKINFPTFIVSLNASALLHLGAIEDPTTGQKAKNLPMAKQTIDILSMLEEKTAGNLDNEEKNLLKNILYDLRLWYVKEKG
jgi:hypothetical protein